MTRILQLNASIFGEGGKSSQLADAFVARWRERDPEATVRRRELGTDPVPHLTHETFQAAGIPAAQRTAAEAAHAALADELVAELLETDVLVIGLPTYNFNLPSSLKAWIDHIARAGATFRYTAQGPEGLVRGVRAFVFVASGGRHAGTDSDFLTGYLRYMLGFVGIDDVTFTYAEGQALDAGTAEQALRAARAEVERLVA